MALQLAAAMVQVQGPQWLAEGGQGGLGAEDPHKVGGQKPGGLLQLVTEVVRIELIVTLHEAARHEVRPS